MKDIKAGKEIITIIIVLTAIAVVAGLLLGVMNKVTAVDETEALKAQVKKLYASPIKEVLDISAYDNLQDTKILNAFVAEDGAYIIKSKSDKAYSGSGLQLIVIIKDGKVHSINGEGNSETPGLGSKALAQSYLQQYMGLSYDFFADDETTERSAEGIKLEWGFSREGDTDADSHSSATPSANSEIEAVSGATKTSNGVKYAVKAALAFYDYMEGNNEDK